MSLERFGLGKCCLEDIAAIFIRIAIAAKVKVMEQVGAIEFGSAYGFEVAGCYTQCGALTLQVLENFVNCGEDADAKVGGPLFDETAHGGASVIEGGTPTMIGDAGELKRVAQYADIGVAVGGDSVEVERTSRDCGERFTKGKVVNGVGALEKRAVYVEEIGVVPIPCGGV